MQRGFRIFLFAALGLTLTGLGWLIPAHLRAVDSAQIQQAGRKTRLVTEEGIQLLNLGKVGPAQMFLQVGLAENIAGTRALAASVTNLISSQPDTVLMGGDPFLDKLVQNDPANPRAVSQPIIDLLRRPENRQRSLEFLRDTRRPMVGEVLKLRAHTNTFYFPPVASASGVALETSILLTGLLLQGDYFALPLQDRIMTLALEANQSGHTRNIEPVLLDLMGLGKRLNWTQLTQFISRIDETNTLRQLAHLARINEDRLPAIFAAVSMSSQPALVAKYLMSHKDSGLRDLTFSLTAGQGGLAELLKRGQRIYYPLAVRQFLVEYDPFGAYFYWILPWVQASPRAMLLVKYLLFLAGGFLLARAYTSSRRAPSLLERPLQVPALVSARHGIWAMFFLLVLIFLSEPYLAQESRPVEIPLRRQLPKPNATVATAAVSSKATPSYMNQMTLVSLTLFFVLQALLYTACLIKLAEIRRQNVDPRLKLKLLENEEHLFDSGLYLGFVGTIISLILMSMGWVKFSLMAGYSSTSFGIIFVSVLKIFNVRPLRRRLILESEIQAP